MEDAADGGAGEAGGVGNLDNAAAVVMAFETFYDSKSTSEGEDEIRIACVSGKFSLLLGRLSCGLAFRG